MWKIYSNTYPIQIPNTLLKNIFCSGEYSWMCQVHNKPKHINLYNYIIYYNNYINYLWAKGKLTMCYVKAHIASFVHLDESAGES